MQRFAFGVDPLQPAPVGVQAGFTGNTNPLGASLNFQFSADRFVRDEEVVGLNPASPTTEFGLFPLILQGLEAPGG